MSASPAARASAAAPASAASQATTASKASAVSPASAVYEGWVRHRRFEPVEHSFRYRFFLTYLDPAHAPGPPGPFPPLPPPPPRAGALPARGPPGGPEPAARPVRPRRRRGPDRRPPDRPGPPVERPALPRPFLQPGQLLLLLRPRRRAGRGGRRRRREHPLGRESRLCPRPRRTGRAGAERRPRQGAARLAADGDGPALRFPRQRARRAALRPHRVAPPRRRGRQVLRRHALAAPPRAQPPADGRTARPLPGDVAAGGGEDLCAVAAAEAEGRPLLPSSGREPAQGVPPAMRDALARGAVSAVMSRGVRSGRIEVVEPGRTRAYGP